MKTPLQHIKLINHQLLSGKTLDINLSYQIFGQELFSAPIILINHALTGNSDVAGENGWWKTLIGENKTIDTNKFTIICFNIPGNGFDGFFIDDYEDFNTKEIASIFLKGLNELNIKKIFALVGGSVGGSIGWEMLSIHHNLTEKFVPIATDFKTSDWLHSQCLVQKFLLESEDQPLEKARIHAMLCYRTPESLNVRFKGEKIEDKSLLKSHDWLNFHGKNLTERFSLKAYYLMNHLLMTIDADEHSLKDIEADIYLISVDSDLFFPVFEIKKCYENLIKSKANAFYHEIKSIHGHDAFLIEYNQLNRILNTIIE